ncbi:UNVERIFIED_ORG: hypothetical protein ABIB13_002737 [Arthrobacter sp. UYEF2]
MTTLPSSATVLIPQAVIPQALSRDAPSHDAPDPQVLTPELLRAWAWHKQGLDGTLLGADAADVYSRAGWARSVGGANPYLTLFARAGTSRAQADADVLSLKIHELPTARGCTYVL